MKATLDVLLNLVWGGRLPERPPLEHAEGLPAPVSQAVALPIVEKVYVFKWMLDSERERQTEAESGTET